MKVPLSWLDEWVPCADVPVERLAELFVERGFPVESIARTGHSYAGIVVGQVLDVRKHPQADRLVLARVDVGDGAERSIVCGAPNLVAGMRVPVALPGTVMPSGMEIKKSKIRGEVSEGMLCSGRELELTEDHSGILGLAPDAPLGRPLAEVLGTSAETVIELEVHYNRPDVMSVAGVARELSAALGRPLRDSAQVRLAQAQKTAAQGPVPIALEDAEGCPRYVGAVLRGVTLAPSPSWLAQRLEQAGVRPLYNVVDITNYVLLELGQPLHAFDLAKLHGPEIRVRRAASGEKITTLDGRERQLTPDHLVIADRDRAVAIAGVMGGQDTEVTEQTKDILLESAYFDPYRIQVAANRFVLKSEASRRFGRGVDPNLAPVAAARAIELLQSVAGARLEEPVGESAARSYAPLTLALEPARVNALMGAELTEKEMEKHLSALGFGVRHNGAFHVTVPTYRRDVSEATDLIEEIARAHGYENLPDVPIGGAAQGAKRDPGLLFARRVREALVGFGFVEALTPSLVDPARAQQTWPLTQEGEPRFARVANPPSPEASVLRTDLAAGLLTVVAHHLRHGAPGTRVFEVGHTFVARHERPAPGDFPEERAWVGFALAGLADPETWEGERGVDFFDAKGVAESLFARLGIDGVKTRAYASPAWKAGEAAEFLAPHRVGWVGQVEPRRARAWKLDRPVYLFLASLAALAAARGAAAYRSFSRFPAVKRDLAFFLPARVSHAEVEEKMRAAAGNLLQSARLFDVYQGTGVPEGQKSLAYSLDFAHPERTLAESEVEEAQAAVVRALAESFGATLRAGAEKK
ncbi:MAG TPA: phenylalanine--tRNA ligase subunit beta [Candidatus Eisenbacteria bacterium]|nr:phenylalanine--tRNA ligase subunit beta [Candidatus Eisenbacteria bacterium]